MTRPFSMDFKKLEELKYILDDSSYVEYIYNKFFENPAAQFKSKEDHSTWSYPECWLARYYCYYILNGHILKDQTILDLGSNFNFYSAWAVLNGAKSSLCVEPDVARFTLGLEYIKIRNLESKINCLNLSIDQYFKSYQDQKFDVVFLLDVLYYLTNGIDVIGFIKTKIKPKFLFVESTVSKDFSEHGHFELWHSSTDTKQFQSFLTESQSCNNLSLRPSTNALKQIFEYYNLKIVSYYDYHDFIGRGESPPRRQGNKVFFVLEVI